MFIAHKRSWFFNCFVRPLVKKVDLQAFLAFLLSLGTFLFTIFEGIKFHISPSVSAGQNKAPAIDPAILSSLKFQAAMPWHFSAALVIMVALLGFYTSKYYKLKNINWTPKSGYKSVHQFSEDLRELNLSDYTSYARKAEEKGLSEKELNKLISNHLKFAQNLCKQAKAVMEANSVRIDRVCIKLEINKKLFKIASTDETIDQSNLHGESCEDNYFWRILNRVHFRYRDWGATHPVCLHPANKKLQSRPRFLAISGISKDTPPPSWIKLVEDFEGDNHVPGDTPRPRSEAATRLWGVFREKVREKYDCCLGMAIAGKALVDPLDDTGSGNRESTNKVIGFIGLDAKASRKLDYLEQEDLEGLAALADASFAVLQNLVAFSRALEIIKGNQ